jgi:hypothetical protein
MHETDDRAVSPLLAGHSRAVQSHLQAMTSHWPPRTLLRGTVNHSRAASRAPTAGLICSSTPNSVRTKTGTSLNLIRTIVLLFRDWDGIVITPPGQLERQAG